MSKKNRIQTIILLSIVIISSFPTKMEGGVANSVEGKVPLSSNEIQSSDSGSMNETVSFIGLELIDLVSRFLELHLTNKTEMTLKVFGPAVNFTGYSSIVTDLRENSSVVSSESSLQYLRIFEQLLERSVLNFTFQYYIISDSIFSSINTSVLLSMISDQFINNNSEVVLLLHYNINDNIGIEDVDQIIQDDFISRNKMLLMPLIQLGRGPTEFSNIHDSTNVLVLNSIYKPLSGEQKLFSLDSWKTFRTSIGHISKQRIWKPDIVFPGNVIISTHEKGQYSSNQSLFPLKEYEFSIFASIIFSTYLTQILSSLDSSLYTPLRLISAIKHSAWLVNTDISAQGAGIPDFVELYDILNQENKKMVSVQIPSGSYSNVYFKQQEDISVLYAEANNTTPIQFSISRSVEDNSFTIEDMGSLSLIITKSSVELIIDIPQNTRIVTLNLNINPSRKMINSTVRITISFRVSGTIVESKQLEYRIKTYLGKFCFLNGFGSSEDKITSGMMGDNLLLRQFLFSTDIISESCEITELKYPNIDGVIVISPNKELKIEERAILDQFVEEGGQLWFFAGIPNRYVRTIALQNWIDKEIRIEDISAIIPLEDNQSTIYFGKTYKIPPAIYFHSDITAFQTTIKMQTRRYITLPENYESVYSKDPSHRFGGVVYLQKVGLGQRWIFSSSAIISYFYSSFIVDNTAINTFKTIVEEIIPSNDPTVTKNIEDGIQISVDQKYKARLIREDSYIIVISKEQTVSYPLSTQTRTISITSQNTKLIIVVHLEGKIRFIKSIESMRTVQYDSSKPPNWSVLIGLGVIFLMVLTFSFKRTRVFNLKSSKNCTNCEGSIRTIPCRWCGYEK